MTEVSAKIEVVGLKEALKTLNKIDKSLRREITKDYKKIVQPVIDGRRRRHPRRWYRREFGGCGYVHPRRSRQPA